MSYMKHIMILIVLVFYLIGCGDLKPVIKYTGNPNDNDFGDFEDEYDGSDDSDSDDDNDVPLGPPTITQNHPAAGIESAINPLQVKIQNFPKTEDSFVRVFGDTDCTTKFGDDINTFNENEILINIYIKEDGPINVIISTMYYDGVTHQFSDCSTTPVNYRFIGTSS